MFGITKSPIDLRPSQAQPLLLDVYSGAAAAYSLRKLRTAYAGPCFRVRRSSDNAETDIGFSGVNLDTAALLTFVGAGNGFVTRWYDQAATSNATQATTTRQPQVVASGLLVQDGIRAAIDFATAKELVFSLSVSSPLTILAVATVQSAGSGYQRLLTGTPDTTVFFGSIDKNFATFFGNGSSWNDIATNTPSRAIGTRSRLAVVTSAGVATPIINGAAQSTKNGTTGNVTSFAIGRFENVATQNWNSTAQELILYTSAQTANVAAIQTDQAGFYA